MATDPRILALDKKLAQLKAHREKLEMAQNNEKRKLENKQKIILGGWLLSNEKELVETIKSKLTRPQDRKAFDLSPLPSPPPASDSPEPSPAFALDAPDPSPAPITEPASKPS